jgi:hypothetical protein
MGLFKGKPGDHGKADSKAAAKANAKAKMKEVAKQRPSGESARELKRQDIEDWKGQR